MAKRININTLSIFISLLAISTTILISVSAHAVAKTKAVVTTGVASAGQPESRRNAIENAMRNAVKQAMSTIVNVELPVENKITDNEEILRQAGVYIQNYKVISEQEKTGLYHVQIEATVELGKVRNDMEAAWLKMKRKQTPRLMVMSMPRSEFNMVPSGTYYIDSARGVVEEEFLKNNFLIVDVNQHISKQNLARLSNNINGLIALARDTGAELLVLTEAIRYFERSRSLYGSNYHFFRTIVQLRIIETGTGKVVFSASRQGEPSASMDPVFDSSRELANAAIKSIVQIWSNNITNPTSYKLTITNIDFSILKKLEQKLRNISGVDNLYVRAFDADQGRIDVEYHGTANDLIKQLTSFQSPGLSITGMSQQTVKAVAR